MIEFNKLPSQLREISGFEIHDARVELAEGEFTGIAAAFNVRVESFIPTIIKPGAFSNTIKRDFKRVKLLWQHNQDEPIGLPVSMSETEKGLHLHGRITMSTQRGKEAVELMKEGVIDAMSIGWTPTSFRFEESGNEIMRIVDELELFEVSLVSFPANPKAKIQRVSSSSPFPIESIERIAGDVASKAFNDLIEKIEKDKLNKQTQALARSRDLLLQLESIDLT